MKKILTLILLLVFFASNAQDTFLHCGKLIDTKNGKVLSEKTIVVSGNKILRIENGYVNSNNSEDRVIDLKNKTVLPGLTDMHVHIEGESSRDSYLNPFILNDADVAFNAAEIAKRTLMAGFTTVRDLGGSGVNVALRNAINAGKTDGPRIYTAEKALATTGGHADPTNGRKKILMGDPGPAEGVVNGVEDASKAVRQRYKNGADWIKITATGGVLSVAKSSKNPQFTEEEIKAIVETAKDYDMQVAAHAHGDEGMQRAIRAGVKTIEHGTLMSDETMELMKNNNAYLVPTITAGKFVSDQAKIENYYPAIIVPKALEIGPKIQDMFGRAYKKGVPIVFGTDAGVFPHGQNAKEFGYMVEAGMPAMEAIQSATVVSAKILKAENEIGQLAPGFFADIIAVNEDPSNNVKTLENVVFVMKNGTIYKD
ncbi:metal-dependent hydrolase family protein [Aequorivita lipolytica]|uniref:Amidohydrolase family protein n=1 Tax=Aequorivita lipolytica TaxID=153267 RepID=A0A5C6YR52_9FLAO|nr:amidohydrolase family protein [Aequorivita lipolytica]TXD70011.1 amidohydrolase family protein [Aequorivita lipolytica]SRX50162.1 Adenine deaminase [Aequorivita lipolytica]